MKKAIVVIATTAMALISIAAAQAAGEPWEGGTSVRSPVEQKLYDVGTKLSPSAPNEYLCLSPDEWSQAVAPEDPAVVWGFVAPSYNQHVVFLSPQACLGVQRLMLGRNGSKMCQSGTQPTFATEARSQTYWTWQTKRVWSKAKGRAESRRVRVRHTRTVYVDVQTGEEPVYGVVCQDWALVLFGGQTASHETVHTLGISNEAATECYGLQALAPFIYELTGDLDFAYEAADDYYAWYVQSGRIDDPVYGSPECRDGGALDLAPDDPSWPTPRPA